MKKNRDLKALSHDIELHAKDVISPLKEDKRYNEVDMKMMRKKFDVLLSDISDIRDWLNDRRETPKKPETEENTVYDIEEVYKTEIAPLAVQIKRICVKNHLPFMLLCAHRNDNDHTSYSSEEFLTGSAKIFLKDDHFEEILLLLSGAKLQPLGSMPDEWESLDRDIADYIDDDLGFEDIGDL